MIGGYTGTGIGVGLACVVVLLTWGLKLLNWVWFEPRRLERCLRKQGLHGNSYKFMFGDVKETFRLRSMAREKPLPSFTNDYASRVIPFQHNLLTTYGKNCISWMGPVPAINIIEPELLREAFTRINEFQKPRINPLVRLLATGLVSYEGEKWALHRKLINPAFHLEKLKLMLPAFTTSVIETVNQWGKIVAKTGSSEIDVWPYLTNLAADVISRAAFGSSYEEGRRIFDLLGEQVELIIRLFQTIYIPGWKYLPTKNNKRMKEVNYELRKLLTGIIEKRKKAMEGGEVAKDDLLGILMESNFKETQTHESTKNQHGMSFEDMIEECKLFYFAGQETTSVLLVWTMILLSKHQDWQARAREEVYNIFGKNQPNFEGLNHLKIVTMILYEVLRLYPPATVISRRVFDHEKKLGNLSVPASVMVNFSILHIHQNVETWGDDAKEFNPERFSEGISKATKGNISFFPFGWGPRICIGQNFSLIEAKMALSMILQRFSFELSPNYAHAPTSVITLKPQFGAPIVLHQL